MNLTIGTLAAATGVHVETVRYYQRRGLLREPPRPLGGIRRYDEHDARRLNFIQKAKHMGFSLDEISSLLRLEDGSHCQEARELGERKLGLVRERIAQLRKVERALQGLLAACRANAGSVSCPLISALLDEQP